MTAQKPLQSSPSIMRAESESPNSDENPSQKQDPLERRRLQNRLSQRNHRRKIRDRIAKLQERVIANELRAAAALNSWDQTYIPPPLVSPYHGPHNDTHFLHSRDPSPLTTEPSTPFISPYAMPPSPSWSNEWSASQHPQIMSAESSFLMDSGFVGDTMCSSQSLTHMISNMGLSNANSSPERDAFHNSNTGGSLSDSFSSANTNQPLYYVATETALPQILQALNTVSPQSNIIVLVPDSTTSATTNPNHSSGLLGNNTLEPSPLTQMNAPSLTCQCQAQSIQAAATSHMVSSPWQIPGSYVASCQSHKQPSATATFPAMRL